MVLEVADDPERVAPGLKQLGAGEQRRPRIRGGDRVKRREEQVGVGDAEDGEHVLGRDLVARVGDELLERPERIAKRARCVACEERDGIGRDRDRLDPGDPAHDRGELLDGRPGEVEAVTAVHDGGQDLRRLGRRQHEDGVRRRLLERLEERVPRLCGEHVRLVEDVDLSLIHI